MGKQNCTGVFQLESGLWAYRYTFTRDGKRASKRGSKDEFGAPLRTKKEAVKARQIAIEQEQDFRKPKPAVRKTIKEVFQEYCTNGRNDRAYQTIRKQDSLWENHLCAKFGNRFVDEISSAEINDYLAALYSLDSRIFACRSCSFFRLVKAKRCRKGVKSPRLGNHCGEAYKIKSVAR